MHNSAMLAHFLLLTAAAVLVGVAGVGCLLVTPDTRLGRLTLTTLGVGGASGFVALSFPDSVCWVVTGGVVVASVSASLDSARVRRWAVASVRACTRRMLLGVAVLLTTVSVWGVGLWNLEGAEPGGQDSSADQVADSSPADLKSAGTAHSDRGTGLLLLSPVAPLSPQEMAAVADQWSAASVTAGQCIRLSDATEQSNCHGWVFTGGRYNLFSGAVETILADNAYTPTAHPAVDDLCVYRSRKDAIIHSGVVRVLLPDGKVLVESKWGRMGVYLHPVELTSYGSRFTYYHTARGGHLLMGLDTAPEAPIRP